jgi:hypothetical protein
MKKFLIFLLVLFIHANGFALIKPYSENKKYWEYNNQPLLLIGGSNTHNLFNSSSINIEDHLTLLKNSGGNYIRNTMSSREKGNVQPHLLLSNGLYDLNQWNNKYWNRLSNFLTIAKNKGIIVQIELWDRWDHVNVPWDKSSWNPKNNINYTTDNSNLIISCNGHADQNLNPFLKTVPSMQNNTIVLRYQQKFIDKILEEISKFDNILLCINNETTEDLKWSDYWVNYIKNKSDKYISDMRNNWNITHSSHVEMYNNELYDFVDISQNNQNSGQLTYNRILSVWNSYLYKNPRPMNMVKIYGGFVSGKNYAGGIIEGKKKFWRSIFAGVASVRFHRPGYGLGLNDIAQTQLKSASIFLGEFDIFSSIPDNSLINNRATDSAYLLKNQHQYAVYLPNGGTVSIKLPNNNFNRKILNIDTNTISNTETINGGNHTLSLSSNTQWLVIFFEDINIPITPPKMKPLEYIDNSTFGGVKS